MKKSLSLLLLLCTLLLVGCSNSQTASSDASSASSDVSESTDDLINGTAYADATKTLGEYLADASGDFLTTDVGIQNDEQIVSVELETDYCLPDLETTEYALQSEKNIAACLRSLNQIETTGDPTEIEYDGYTGIEITTTKGAYYIGESSAQISYSGNLWYNVEDKAYVKGAFQAIGLDLKENEPEVYEQMSFDTNGPYESNYLYVE